MSILGSRDKKPTPLGVSFLVYVVRLRSDARTHYIRHVVDDLVQVCASILESVEYYSALFTHKGLEPVTIRGVTDNVARKRYES